jgi:6-phosphogluconolactonase
VDFFQRRSRVNRRATLGLGLGTLATLATLMGTSMAFALNNEDKRNGFARFAYVGCRTTKERNARGEGIGVYRVDSIRGEWTPVQLLKDLVNPSFLAFDRSQRFLYAVHGDMSEVSAFGISPESGELTFLNRQSTEGKNPAHLLVDESNRFLIVANYATGSLVVLPRNPDGSLGAVQQVELLPGTPGPHKVDQGFSHPHHLVYDRRRSWIAVPDKGLDRIFTYRFDANTGRLIPGPSPFVQVRPGAGPRHIVFHPTAPLAIVAHELDSSVGTYRFDVNSGGFAPIQIVPSIPDVYTGANTAAEIEIAPSGRFVYVSNRGSDAIATFSVDAASGRLTPVGWTPSEGTGPRFFALDPSGQLLHAANENSDTIVPFQVDAESGALKRGGPPIRTGSPVCIVFSTK